MTDHTFVGFGFGPIQSALFVSEAFSSGNFKRIVVAEVDQALVDALRAKNGSYFVNVACSDGVEVVQIDNVELLNPTVDADRQALLEALTEATEIVTSLPSVSFYEKGVSALIAEGLKNSTAAGTIIYTAENNNHAAEVLQASVGKVDSKKVQFLNTVIGKMSQVVTDKADIAEMKLAPMMQGIDRAFLVEEFNRILVTKCSLVNFRPGIEVFVEKTDLLPFEEAKLYGHNAIHALLGYLGLAKGYEKMSELKGDAGLMKIARAAFLDESGAALIKKYSRLGDKLFTEQGYKEYADDLLERMTNPYLADAAARAGRDPLRKLGYDDRIFGTMRLAIEYGIDPVNMAVGAMAGIQALLNNPDEYDLPQNLCDNAPTAQILEWLWKDAKGEDIQRFANLLDEAKPKLTELLK